MDLTNARPELPDDWSKDQRDLVKRMLIKDPVERIRMKEIRVGPFSVAYQACSDVRRTHGRPTRAPR
jgi:serine/threonine protein kinase